MFRSVNTSGNNQITLEEFKIAMGDMPPKDHQFVSFALDTLFFKYLIEPSYTLLLKVVNNISVFINKLLKNNVSSDCIVFV